MNISHIKLPPMEGNCEYTGKDFERACKIAQRTDAGIYEHDERRGEFLVLTEAQRSRMWTLGGLPHGWRRY